MWKKSLLVFLFSLSTLKAELNRETMRKKNKFISPTLDSKTNEVMKGQNVSLICSNQNKSLHITYVLFRSEKHIRTQNSTGEPVIFNLSISEAQDLGPYKCKAKVSNCWKYSNSFNFTFMDPVTTPVLNITVVKNQTNNYLILRCISFHGSLPINYTFFEKGIVVSPVISMYKREPAEFTLIQKNTGGWEEYKCKANNRLPDRAKYSHPVTMPSTGGHSCPLCLQLLLPVLLLVLSVTLILAFWMLPKYKAIYIGKAMRDKTPRDYGNTSTEVGIYANVHTKQADEESMPSLEPRHCVSSAQDETKHSQEIHYSNPMFRKVTPRDHEAYNDDKARCVYAELNL
ncbi:allergin-1 isoform X1 [Molossus molossus]|uniref:allergin-1 isoform X1 n=1 Tax=Molossus molossus TaxID=27622 RepID=UPI001746DD7C|nr:allergin-1 isoform X1 [Molossus molossus]KAF6416430.1 mast cell immunoglobulin like receptor 1 [Molossus molossus]